MSSILIVRFSNKTHVTSAYLTLEKRKEEKFASNQLCLPSHLPANLLLFSPSNRNSDVQYFNSALFKQNSRNQRLFNIGEAQRGEIRV